MNTTSFFVDEARVFAKVRQQQRSINQLTDDQLTALISDMTAIAANGVAWLEAAVSLRLCGDTAREVARYMVARQQLLATPHQKEIPGDSRPPVLRFTAPQREELQLQRGQLAAHTLWLLESFGVDEAGFSNYVSLYCAWENGRGDGVEETLAVVHTERAEHPGNAQFLRLALLSLNLLPTPAKSGRSTTASAGRGGLSPSADVVPALRYATPTPAIVNTRDLAERLTQKDFHRRHAPDLAPPPPKGATS